MVQTVTFECGHSETLTAPVTFFRRCPACQAAWRAGRETALAASGYTLDDVFATDSSDDARMPAPLTEADKASIATLHQELQEKAARDRAWAEQEAWENW